MPVAPGGGSASHRLRITNDSPDARPCLSAATVGDAPRREARHERKAGWCLMSLSVNFVNMHTDPNGTVLRAPSARTIKERGPSRPCERCTRFSTSTE